MIVFGGILLFRARIHNNKKLPFGAIRTAKQIQVGHKCALWCHPRS